MAALVVVSSIGLILVVAWDVFETILLPRRVTRRFRLTRLFYRSTWVPWSTFARRIRSAKRRDAFLSFFGPLSLLLLLSVWALGMILGFALLHWSAGSRLQDGGAPLGIVTYVYMSGTTFFTLGFGDVTPLDPVGRLLAVAESGVGFGLLALIIGYLPVIYQAFSRREMNITLLDARAGSPPTAAELRRRQGRHMEDVERLLRDWERWSADLMESHLSYPVLCYYRSQHDNQSWLAALTTILDASALVLAGGEGGAARQARLTFAMARHALVDLAQVFHAAPREAPDRLPPAELARLRAALEASGAELRGGREADEKLGRLRRMYEPFVFALARHLVLTVPAWIAPAEVVDNWRTSPWGRISAAGSGPTDDEHS
jgi:hypothetical protein